jgi:hypothetical protein
MQQKILANSEINNSGTLKNIVKMVLNDDDDDDDDKCL